jgi:hypothetical protein
VSKESVMLKPGSGASRTQSGCNSKDDTAVVLGHEVLSCNREDAFEVVASERQSQLTSIGDVLQLVDDVVVVAGHHEAWEIGAVS